MLHHNFHHRRHKSKSPNKLKFPIEIGKAFWADPADANAFNMKACTLETGEDAFVAKAIVNYQEATGFTTRNSSEAYVSYGYQEHIKGDFKVLSTTSPEKFVWLPGRGGKSPDTAVKGGVDAGVQMTIGRTCTPLTDGRSSKHSTPIEVNRFLNEQGRRLGKVHPVYGFMYIPYNGVEYTYGVYEVLCHKVSPGSLKRICKWKILTVLQKHKQKCSAIDQLSLPFLLKDYLKDVL